MRIAIVTILLVSAISTHSTTCEDDVFEQHEKERKMDTNMHECRACKMIPLVADTNCPLMNYDCEEDLLITANVLFADECACSQLQCRDANATLAVGGDLVGKVRCKDLKWTKSSNVTAASAVCGRKCDIGVCEVLPLDYFEGQDILGPITVSPPDAQHPCAWADCQIGAIAKKDTSNIVYRGLSSFACSGDRSWKYISPGQPLRHLHDVACIIKDCESLPFGSTSEMCQSKYSCSAPDFVDGDGDDWKKMTCAEANALRLSEENKEAAPTCKIGQWSVDASDIEDTTKVVCITCPDVKGELSDPDQPVVSYKNKDVTCLNGELTVEYESGGPKQTPVTSLTCSGDFAWTSTGGDFTPFVSLEDAVEQGVTWKARCIVAIPKPCEELPTTVDRDFCYVPEVPENRKYARYECRLPVYEATPVSKMVCVTAGETRLRYSDDVDTIIHPTCASGQWSDVTTKIPSTTIVTCLRCRSFIGPVNPPTERWEYTENGRRIECPTRPLVIDIPATGKKFVVQKILCNHETFIWGVDGADIGGYQSLTDIHDHSVDFSIHCLYPNEM